MVSRSQVKKVYQGKGMVTVSRVASRPGEVRCELVTGFGEAKVPMTLARGV